MVDDDHHFSSLGLVRERTDENQQRTRITWFPETQQRSRNLMWIRKDKEARQIYLVLLYWD